MNINSHLHRKLQLRKSGIHSMSIWQIVHIDLYLLLGLIALITTGFFILYSASNQQLTIVISQAIHIGLALLLMIVLAQIPPEIYRSWSPWLYCIVTFLLVIVLIIGHIGKGAQRWLGFGLMTFQPAELMKIVIPMTLAWYFSDRVLPPKIKDLLIAAVIILIPAVLTAKQPDLGTAILLVIAGGSVLLFAGISGRLITTLFALIAACMPILWHFMHDYQRQRILTFFNPERDPLGAGYHTIQAKIAIGSGGIFGKGWLHGTQSHLNFLPEHATDFIFAVSGEEFGLIGSILLIALYAFISCRCLYIASRAQSTYTRLLAGSLSLTFFIAAFINIGMVTGILPVVGLPLLLVSYGGSSMITLLASFGILMSIYGHRKLYES